MGELGHCDPDRARYVGTQLTSYFSFGELFNQNIPAWVQNTEEWEMSGFRLMLDAEDEKPASNNTQVWPFFHLQPPLLLSHAHTLCTDA